MQEKSLTADNKTSNSSNFLFPAYASNSFNDGSNKTTNVTEDWLCNSSFSTDALQASLKLHESAVDLKEDEPEIVYEKKKKSSKHLKKKKKRRKEKYENNDGIELEPKSSNAESSILQSYFNKFTFIEDTGLSDERAFRTDLKPDFETLQFSSFDRATIAKYYERFKLHIGCSKQELIQFQKEEQIKNSKKTNRYFSKHNMKQLNSIASKDMSITTLTTKSTQELLEFIPINLNVSKAFSEQTSFSGPYLEWKLSQAQASNSEKESSGGDGLSFENQELFKKTADYNNRLTESPHDEKLWLEFVHFQHSFYQSKIFQKNEQMSTNDLVEKQISILDKALSYNPSSINLIVHKLNLLANVKETEALIPEWENLIFYHPNNVLAWQHYLLFIMSDISYFNVMRLSKIYKKCLKCLSNIEQGVMRSHSSPPGLLFDIIEILSDICGIFLNSGHIERAYSIFQAIVEFNFFIPPSVVLLELCTDRLTYFEQFWDCSSARIGENKALGWAITISEQRIASNEETSKFNFSELEDKILALKLPEWQTWLEFEFLRTSRYWLPWRPSPETEETSDDIDDPDRIVAFDKISDFLFKIEEEKPKFILLCKFLEFLGVRLHFSNCSFFPVRSKKQILFLETFDYLLDIFHDIFPNQNVPECLILREIKPCDNTVFINNTFSQSAESFSEYYKTLITHLHLIHNINNILLSDKQKHSSEFKNLRKVTKNLLKKPENRNCLFLWSKYLYLEYFNGNLDTVDQMFDKLFLSSSESFQSGQCDNKPLWHFVRNYVEMCTGINSQFLRTINKPLSGSEHRIVWILCQLGNKEIYLQTTPHVKVSPALLLKAITNFKQSIKEELSILESDSNFLCKCLQPDTMPIIDCLLCCIYLHYFGHGLNSCIDYIEGNFKIFEEKIKEKSSPLLRHIKEQIVICKAEILNFHANIYPSSFKIFHPFLCVAVEMFPNNVRLLHLLVKTKTASVIVGPTRRFFYKLLEDQSNKFSALTWLFAIIFELTICYYIKAPLENLDNETYESRETLSNMSSGIIWKIRSLFEKCFGSTDLRHCVALWRCYVKFEVLIKDREKAIAVFHKALQNCPWSKALILDGIEYFNNEFEQLIGMMNDKQIRVCTPLEEIKLLMEHL